ncbi:hypothetical protein E3T25_04715 [Cryobacterium sandaracinum]|uniref:Uncharacterized protein n=1 Tax=Cryobacterium sandaracinum TaxID=1259247 RepID=A0ABY2JJJ9_9MICO|nr:hypothetical protein [Cryobacterium sandaracinum]TFD04821.1 hypothetical protein E3T25_04715 [Cryobacterium sandaracinum]
MNLDEHALASLTRVTRLVTLMQPLNYFVLYDDATSTSQGPARYSSLDEHLEPALVGLLFALHLPRHRQDPIDTSLEELSKARGLEQRPNIYICSVREFEEGALPVDNRTLAICPPEHLEDVKERCSTMQFLLPPLSFTELTTDVLRTVWDQIASLTVPTENLRTANQQFVPFDLSAIEVPNGFLRYQLTDQSVETTDRTAVERIEDSLHLRALISSLGALESAGATEESAARDLPKEYRKRAQSLRLPVAMAAPGVSPSEIGAVASRLGCSR